MDGKKLRPWTFKDSERIQIDEEGRFCVDGKPLAFLDLLGREGKVLAYITAGSALAVAKVSIIRLVLDILR